jgi:hypothetical protein
VQQTDCKMNETDVLKVVRAEIHQEHTLISYRMSWYVASQSLLIAAYGVIFSQASSSAAILLDWMPWLGVLTSILTFASVVAALWAQAIVAAKEQELVGILRRQAPEIADHYVACTCARKYGMWIHRLGVSPAVLIPFVFMAMWASVLART